MLRWFLALAVVSAPAFARPRKKPAPDFVPDCCAAPAKSPDELNFERKEREAAEYQARVGRQVEDQQIRAMADQYAARFADELRIGQIGYSSRRDDTFYYRGNGWDCQVRVSHGVNGFENNCQDYFTGSLGCTSGTVNRSQSYRDSTPRPLEQNGRCYQPGHDYGYRWGHRF